MTIVLVAFILISEAPVKRSEMEPACFPHNSLVTLSNGQSTQIENIQKGDQLLTWSTSSQTTIPTSFISWLHNDQNTTNYFVEVVHEYGRFSVTPDHYIYLFNGKLVPAGQLSVGVGIRYINQSERSLESRIISVKGKTTKGVYAPLTSEGSLIVENVLFSNYAVVSKPIFAKLALLPFTSLLPNFLINDQILQLYTHTLYKLATIGLNHLIL